jgi:hypothetical protein
MAEGFRQCAQRLLDQFCKPFLAHMIGQSRILTERFYPMMKVIP